MRTCTQRMWFPPGARLASLRKETSFGNLYQLVTATTV